MQKKNIWTIIFIAYMMLISNPSAGLFVFGRQERSAIFFKHVIPMTNESEEENQGYHKGSILQVLPNLVSGGVERGTVDVAKMLAAKNYNSIVASSGGVLEPQLTQNGCIHIKKNLCSKNPITMWRNNGVLQGIIKDYKINVVHARSRAPAWSAYYAARAMDVPFLTTFHGIYRMSNILKKHYNSIMTKGDHVIAVSHFVKRHMIENYEIDPRKISVIHRGIDDVYFDPAIVTDEMVSKYCKNYHLNRDVPIILLPARMTNWKGQLALVEALNKIRHLDFRCLMVGDVSRHPNYVERLRRYITELKLQSRVQIYGAEGSMLGLYSIADIVLSTSIEPEAFGRVIVEAQAMEKLAIATNIGGGAETVVDGKSGFHVVPGDSNELAEKLQYCLSIVGSSRAQRFGQAARKHAVDNFGLDKMLTKVLNIYEDLL